MMPLVGDLLKAQREARGWSVAQAAKASSLHSRTITAVEAGLGCWVSADALARAYSKQLKATATRGRKRTLRDVAQAAGVTEDAARSALHLIETGNPSQYLNPNVATVESVVEVLKGKITLS